MADRWDLFHRGVFDATDDWEAPLLPRLVLDEAAGVLRVAPVSELEAVLAVEPLVVAEDLVEHDDGSVRSVGRVDATELPRMDLILTTHRLVVLAADESVAPDLSSPVAAVSAPHHPSARVPDAHGAAETGLGGSGGGGWPGWDDTPPGGPGNPLLAPGDALLASLEGGVLHSTHQVEPAFGALAELISYLQRVVRFAATAIPWACVSALRVNHPWEVDLGGGPGSHRSLGIRLTVEYPSGAGSTHWIVAGLRHDHRLGDLREQVFSAVLRQKALLFRQQECGRSLLLLGEAMAQGLEPFSPIEGQHTSLGPAVISAVP